MNLGGALDREGRSDEALQQYYAAQQDNPRYGTAAYDIAVQMQKRGRLRDAIHYYESAIALTQNEDPDLVSHTYSNLGQVHAFLGEQPAAKTSFEKALALDPLNFSSNLGLAKILVNEGKPEPAVKLLGTALNILPTAEGYYYLGLAWEEEAQSAQAQAAYRHAVQLDPNLEAAQKRLKAIIP